jgi:hypothetical protein
MLSTVQKPPPKGRLILRGSRSGCCLVPLGEEYFPPTQAIAKTKPLYFRKASVEPQLL